MYKQNPVTHQLALASQINGSVPTTTSLKATTPPIAQLSSDGARWAGAVCAPNGNIYLVPCRNGHPAGKIEPNGTITYTITPNSPSANAYFGACLGADGKIYSAPYDATTGIYIIDPLTDTGSISALGATLTGSQKWSHCVNGGNGKVYGIPYDATDILIIDTATGTATRSAMGATLTGTGKWIGGVLGPDGKIYGIPCNASDILIIDPVAGTATRSAMGATLTGATKWAGGVLGPDGKIYGIPLSADTVLVIDPLASTSSLTNFGVTIPTSGSKWSGGVLGPNGKIYGVPYNSNTLFILDVANQTLSMPTDANLTAQAGKYFNGCINLNGEMFFATSYAPDVFNIRFGNNAKYSKLVTLSPYINRN